MNKVVCGIYCATNKINGKKYIGQSIDIKRRWYEHRYPYGHPKEIYYFQRALLKYGYNGFIWEILEECPQEMLNEREQYYISFYHTFIGDPQCHGYNSTKGGDTPSFNTRKVLQYDSKGNFIKLYNSATEASKETGIGKSFIYSCCNKNCKSAKGYQFIYEGDKPPTKYIKYYLYQIDKDTNKVLKRFDSLKEASEETGILDHCIAACYLGKTKTSGGYKWVRVPIE